MGDADGMIAVAIVLHRGTVLVGRRHPDAADAPGRHEFPGGKVERGETPAAAALREVREETGLEVTIGPLLDTASAASHAGPIKVLFLAAQPVDPTAAPMPPFEWVSLDRLGDLEFPQANRRVLDRLAREAMPRHPHGGS